MGEERRKSFSFFFLRAEQTEATMKDRMAAEPAVEFARLCLLASLLVRQ
jgi:hypothetical protein